MKVLDLFSGIGGFSLGLERAGMETIAFCEIEEYPRKILKKHWPDVLIYEEMKENDPWEWRARNLRRNITKNITREWLLEKYNGQFGRCALTGRLITAMNFHIDHILPKSLGGDHELTNLRLVCESANLAKSGMTDEDLFELCSDILKHNRQLNTAQTATHD